jgi:hypothetical protein
MYQLNVMMAAPRKASALPRNAAVANPATMIPV